MARVVSLKCDKCGLEATNDINRISLWLHRIRFEKYDVVAMACDDDAIYLCGKCAKALQKWLKEG